MTHAEHHGSPLTIAPIGWERIDNVRELWLALHRHHISIGSRPLLDDEAASWAARRAGYVDWLRSGSGFVLLAEQQGQPVGYAAVHLQEGPDDTYPVGMRWADIYSLSVRPDARGQGIGTRLLDSVDAMLATFGIHDVAVSAMVENDDALRLYQSRGFVPREIVLMRFGAAK